MVITIQLRKVKLELTSYEIENIIEELECAHHNIYTFLNYSKTIKKLKDALEGKK